MNPVCGHVITDDGFSSPDIGVVFKPPALDFDCSNLLYTFLPQMTKKKLYKRKMEQAYDFDSVAVEKLLWTIAAIFVVAVHFIKSSDAVDVIGWVHFVSSFNAREEKRRSELSFFSEQIQKLRD